MILTAFLLFSLIAVLGLVVNSPSTGTATGTRLYPVVWLMLVCFAAFRPLGIDQDSRGYELYYNLEPEMLWLTAEPTFAFLVNGTRAVADGNGLLLLFLIYACIGVAIKFVAIRKLTDLIWLTLVVYFSTYFLLHEFTQIRAAVASGLLLLAIVPAAERKPYQFFVLITAAALFHYSAIVAYPVYFLSNERLTKGWKIALAAAIPLGALVHFLHINPVLMIPIETVKMKMAAYQLIEAERNLKLNVFNALYLIRYAVFFYLLYHSRLLQARSKYFPILLKIYAGSMFAYLTLSDNSTIAMRISELLGIVEVILIPLLYYTVRPRIVSGTLVFLFAAISLGINIFWTELIYAVPQGPLL